jgi:hypothetical protein
VEINSYLRRAPEGEPFKLVENAGLDDLVLIMDEAHRYRADSSLQSIEDQFFEPASDLTMRRLLAGLLGHISTYMAGK